MHCALSVAVPCQPVPDAEPFFSWCAAQDNFGEGPHERQLVAERHTSGFAYRLPLKVACSNPIKSDS